MVFTSHVLFCVILPSFILCTWCFLYYSISVFISFPRSFSTLSFHFLFSLPFLSLYLFLAVVHIFDMLFATKRLWVFKAWMLRTRCSCYKMTSWDPFFWLQNAFWSFKQMLEVTKSRSTKSDSQISSYKMSSQPQFQGLRNIKKNKI